MRYPARIRLLVMTSAASSAAVSCSDAGAPENAAHPSAIEFDGGALLAHVTALAHDSMCGRRAGSPYERRAADYLEAKFADAGLLPDARDGYRQSVLVGPPPPPQETPPSTGCGGELTGTSQNVLGVLPGAGDLAGQWVILGAHYDHLGWDERDGAAIIYNGADDNASGTGLMLEVARLLGRWLSAHAAESPPHRSIMFQAYGAEEAGLVGSSRYAVDPSVPSDSIVAMLNLDMVGRLRDGTFYLAGLDTSPFWREVLAAVALRGLIAVGDDESLQRSDQLPFLQQGIPVLHFFTGLHEQYHRPEDDAELIHVEGMQAVGRVVMGVLWEAATDGMINDQ